MLPGFKKINDVEISNRLAAAERQRQYISTSEPRPPRGLELLLLKLRARLKRLGRHNKP